MKRCPRCGATKSLSLFNRDSTRHDGYTAHCKQCRQERHKEYRARPEVKERNRLADRLARQRPDVKEKHRLWLREYKQSEKGKARARQLNKEYRQRPEIRAKQNAQNMFRRKTAQQALWELAGVFVNTHLALQVLREILNPPKETTNA